ncbi:putative phage tail protein [Marinicrinis lubricantis]|uniref:Phage tail protein n=1 Tax=Marinicrinis lubricantis TaxID=2086470 RepID=A0ABW1IHJ6_9BACL
MSYLGEMLGLLQPFQRRSTVFKDMFTAESEQFQKYDETLEDLKRQLSVDTATWGLEIYEEEYGIPVDTTKSYSERRSVIKSKMRGTGKVDAALIKLVADSYSNGGVDVDFDGAIRITFTNVIGAPPNIEDLKEAIEEVKPAHIRIKYGYKYLLIQQVQAMTINELQSRPLTDFAPFIPV